MPQKNAKTNHRLGKNICKDTTDKGLLSKTHTQRTLQMSGKKATPIKHGPRFLRGFSGSSVG